MASQCSTGKDTSSQNQPPSCENKRSLSNKPLEFPTYDPSRRYTPKFPSRSTPNPTYTSSPDTPNPNLESPLKEELRDVTPEELVFHVPNNEVNQLFRHTHAYLKSIGQILAIYQIPRAQSSQRRTRPYEEGGFGPPKPPEKNTTGATPTSPRPNFRFIATMVANRPWLAADAVTVPEAQHPLPKHPQKLLTKFDPGNDITPEDHIKQFMLSLRLSDVQHEYVVYILFPYAFVGQASTWFFSLAPGSIASWKQFETAFISQFGDYKTSRMMVLELSRMRRDKKDGIKDFNQRFINHLNHIPKKPTESIQVEFYTATLPPSVA
ncbi:unnamed protein product, partial [Adineta steineri]